MSIEFCREYLSDLILKKLKHQAEDISAQWHSPKNTPTRHFYVDNLLPKNICEKIYDEFPKDINMWNQRSSFRERKKTYAKLKDFSELLNEITFAIQGKKVILEIEKLIGIDDMVGDPYLYAGGLSMMGMGDFLNPHIDNSHDMNREKYRRLNLLYYVTPDWQKDNGGNLELWDEKVTSPVEIVSRFNRLVIMETNRGSWHSVNPVKVDGFRCCVSNYYFSETSPTGEDYYHVTSFLGRPGQGFRRAVGVLDNALRQTVATVSKKSRGKDLVNGPNM